MISIVPTVTSVSVPVVRHCRGLLEAAPYFSACAMKVNSRDRPPIYID